MAVLEDGSETIDTGPNLEFDPDFDALERAAQGKPDQQFGDTIIPAEEPDWKDVVARAEALVARSRDLRILGQLAVARLQLAGMPGYAGVVADIRQLLEQAWDQVHPQLDPEDDNDPTLRANALLRLGDPRRVMRTLRDMPLAMSPRAGKIGWREIGYTTGALELEAGAEKPTEAAILAAFKETDQAKLAALREAVASTQKDLGAIGRIFDEKAGYGTGPSLDDLVKIVGEIRRYLDRYSPSGDAEPAAAEAETEAETAAPEAGQPVAAATRAAGAVTARSLTSIGTRAEAVHLLDLVSDYYSRYEPSSPRPLLIDRARRLADKTFIEILRDMAPDGLGQAQNIAGERDQ